MIRRFDLCRWSVPDDLEEALMVEPVDPFKRCELHRLQTSAGPSRANHLRLVQPDDRLGQGVVIRIANAPHRLLDAGLGQAFGVADGQVLRSPVPVMVGVNCFFRRPKVLMVADHPPVRISVVTCLASPAD